MTIQQFNKLKCGDIVHIQKFGKNYYPSNVPVVKIDRTNKKVMGMLNNNFYHYSKVNIGFHPACFNMCGFCGPTKIIESLEYDKEAVEKQKIIFH